MSGHRCSTQEGRMALHRVEPSEDTDRYLVIPNAPLLALCRSQALVRAEAINVNSICNDLNL
jgi:hypothetical protein